MTPVTEAAAGEPLRVLTITQPWASLIAAGVKTVETRSWPTRWRGPLAIHAAVSFPKPTPRRWCAQLCESDRFAQALDGRTLDELPVGRIVAVVDLVDVEQVPHHGDWPRGLLARWRGGDEKFFGDFSPGRWGWMLAAQHPLLDPVRADGRQGIWHAPPSVAAAVRAQVETATGRTAESTG